MRILFLALASFLLFVSNIFAQIPSTEVRAVWLTTNWRLDWPRSTSSVEAQKKELCSILDKLQENNINTILFQTRTQGKVLYRSSIEPMSPYFDSNKFDPLEFAVSECHKRGMECHAWLVTFTMEPAQFAKTKSRSKRKRTVIKDKPDYYKLVNNNWYLDPGRPESRNLILSLAKEIVSKYDVDGLHFDYIRYPSNTKKFPDDDSYKKYGKGKNIYDWRRENINQLVASVYDEVKSIKKWVQISSSPLGRYRVLPEVAPNDGWTAYETVFQDAGYWLKSGKHDLVFPMMYYKNHYFYPFLDDWKANANGRIVVPGLGAYQMDELNWELKDITDQINYTRKKDIQGQAYFRAGNILNNLKGIKDSMNSYYAYPAKLPALKWLNDEAPNSPINLRVYKDKNGYLNITWDAPQDDETFSYTIYASQNEDIDRNDARNILATGIRSNHYSFAVSEGDFGFYYAVSASDRYHNESILCFPAFFSHSVNEQ